MVQIVALTHRVIAFAVNTMEIFIEIADVGVKIVLGDRSLFNEDFSKFTSNEQASSDFFRLNIHKRSDPHPPGSFIATSIDIYSNNGKKIIKRQDFEAELDLNSWEGSASISSPHSFEALLRIAYSFILPQKEGLVVHAASVVKGGLSYLFPGKSGAGKTTIVNLSPGAKILTDDVSVIRGINSQPVAYGTPFHGSLEEPGKNIKEPLAGIYFPVKDKRDYIEKLHPKSALERLLQNIVFFGEEKKLIRKAFKFSHQLVKQLPCYNLHFRRDSSVWQCIHEKQGKN